ncbi:ANKRD17 [Symbiodinium natans]|uniref:ANKRD17 protein n=1 Tax=Symbiodinium natans TaxID=878477 RepID=A0A812SF23_9DINO|nr:ANKRD17 [Symbiodinium natans]
MSQQQRQEYQAQAYALMASIEGTSPASETLRRRLQALAEEVPPPGAEVETVENHESAELEEEMGEVEEEFTEVDIGCSWTLTGALIFNIIMFYFINYPDDDIKRYTWSIINTTLSIFVAVMSFQGVDEMMLHFVIDPALGVFPKGWQELVRVMSGFVIFLFWFALAHTVVAYFAGLVCNPEEDPSQLMTKKWTVADAMRGDNGEVVEGHNLVREGLSKGIATVDGVEVFVKNRAVLHEGYERRTKCWAMLFAHMAGFAMISAGGDLQHAAPFVNNPGMSWVSVVLCALFLLLLFTATAFLYKEGPEFEEARKLYKEEGLDAEDDIFCLAVSFLCVQSLRFSLSGSLPSKLGLYHHPETEESQLIGLYVSAVAMVGVTVAAAVLLRKGRVKDLIVGTASMGFAWCVLFATRAAFDAWPFLQEKKITPATIEGRVLLAMTLSLFACAVIVVLDKIEDGLDKEGDAEQLHKLLKNIITGLSILIGFTWEHTFDGCVEAISSLWSNVLLGKLVLTLVIVVIVVPAWRRYILAKVVDLHKAQRERKEAFEKLKDGYSHRVSDESSEEEPSARLLC